MVCDVMRRRTAAGDRVDTCWTAYLGFQPVNLEEATAADFISWLKSFVVVRGYRASQYRDPVSHVFLGGRGEAEEAAEQTAAIR